MIEPKTVLLLGASGMGMAPLALYLHGAGVSVEAYDDRFCEPLRSMMIDAGITVLSEATPTRKPDCVIRSSAIGETDDRVGFFRRQSVPIYRRGEFVSRLLEGKRTVIVVGSHGKTSATGMLVWGLKQIDFPFSYLVGGRFKEDVLPPAEFNRSSWVVLEVDESDGTIDGFAPDYTLALNCEWDHVDQYDDSQAFLKTLGDLFKRTRKAAVFPENSNIDKLVKKLDLSEDVHRFRPHENPACFEESNQRAVQALAKSMGVDLSKVDFSLFPGMERRQSLLFESEQRMIMEDYAHHPSEVRAFLAQRRFAAPNDLLRVVFQPHRFSRTRAHAKGFAEELSVADELHLIQTYGAFEDFDAEGTVEALSGHLPPRLREDAKVYEDFPELRTALRGKPRGKLKRDQVLFVGAGNLDRWAHAFASYEKSKDDRDKAFADYLANRLSPACDLRFKESMSSKTTMRVGGEALWYAEPGTLEDLLNLVEASHLFELPRAMIGRGSNLIIPDDGYAGLALRLKGSFWSEVSLRSEALVVGAGASLREICRIACAGGLKGFEFLEGIPGTLGGALRMNAGAMGWETFDLVDWVLFLLPDGSMRRIDGSELNVGYRYCREAVEGIALRAKLRSEGRSDHRAIRKAIDNMAKRRRKSQPREASAGCIFRNFGEESAGALIDEVGLKGEREGNAVVSDVHANFIVNEGGASAEEVIELIRRVRKRVKESNGMELEPEIGVLGKNWDEYLS